MGNVITVIVAIVIILVAVFGVAFLGGLIAAPFVMLGWNFVMPYVFGLPTIGYWHGFWMFFLSNVLIKSTQTNASSNK